MNLQPVPLLRLATCEASGGGMTAAGRLEPFLADRCAPGLGSCEAVIKKPTLPGVVPRRASAPVTPPLPCRYPSRMASGPCVPILLFSRRFRPIRKRNPIALALHAQMQELCVSRYDNRAATLGGSK